MKNKDTGFLFKAVFVFCISVPLYGKISQNSEFLSTFTGLGYPIYLSYILGAAYVLGLIAIYQSKRPKLKEWAFAGFTFAITGALLSHLFNAQWGMSLWALTTLIFLAFTYTTENPRTANIA